MTGDKNLSRLAVRLVLEENILFEIHPFSVSKCLYATGSGTVCLYATDAPENVKKRLIRRFFYLKVSGRDESG